MLHITRSLCLTYLAQTIKMDGFENRKEICNCRHDTGCNRPATVTARKRRSWRSPVPVVAEVMRSHAELFGKEPLFSLTNSEADEEMPSDCVSESGESHNRRNGSTSLSSTVSQSETMRLGKFSEESASDTSAISSNNDSQDETATFQTHSNLYLSTSVKKHVLTLSGNRRVRLRAVRLRVGHNKRQDVSPRNSEESEDDYRSDSTDEGDSSVDQQHESQENNHPVTDRGPASAILTGVHNHNSKRDENDGSIDPDNHDIETINCEKRTKNQEIVSMVDSVRVKNEPQDLTALRRALCPRVLLRRLSMETVQALSGSKSRSTRRKVRKGVVSPVPSSEQALPEVPFSVLALAAPSSECALHKPSRTRASASASSERALPSPSSKYALALPSSEGVSNNRSDMQSSEYEGHGILDQESYSLTLTSTANRNNSSSRRRKLRQLEETNDDNVTLPNIRSPPGRTSARNQQNKSTAPACQTCGEVCETKKALREHERVHGFTCDVCGRKFKYASALTEHKQSIHENVVFVCTFCEMEFSSQKTLLVHQRRHTGEKPFNCSYCDKTFAHRTSMVTHERKHTGSKPFVCAVCGKAHSDRANLRRHALSHIDDPDEYPYRCDKCDRKFKYKSSMTSHERSHLRQENLHKHAFDKCSNMFSTKLALRKHWGSAHPRFPCQLCNQSFFTQGTLKTHASKHRGAKRFQ